MSDDQAFGEWCVVELMGHNRTGAYVTEAKIAGAMLLRLDIHGLEGGPQVTQFIPPPPGGPLYRLTPVSEPVARAIGQRSLAQSPPVARWELPGPELDAGQGDDLSGGDDDEDPY